MPALKIMECVKCGERFELLPGKPGKINECKDCAEDIPVVFAEQSDDDGSWTINKRPLGLTTELKPTWVKINEKAT